MRTDSAEVRAHYITVELSPVSNFEVHSLRRSRSSEHTITLARVLNSKCKPLMVTRDGYNPESGLILQKSGSRM